MNITTLSNFKARINDIEFDNEQDFNSVSFLLENIEERFNISITDPDFTKDVKDFVELASIKVDNFSYGELENATVESIMNATKLSDIQFLANEYDEGNYKWNSYINDKYRLLTPIEAERLQDFPDDWTKFKLTSKGDVVEVSDRMRMFCMGNALVTGIVTRIANGIKNIELM